MLDELTRLELALLCMLIGIFIGAWLATWTLRGGK